MIQKISIVLNLVLLCIPCLAQDRSWRFDSDKSLADWEITGKVAIDTEKNHSGTGGAMRIDPESKAVIKLRKHDASGKISMWIYDDGTAPEPPTQRRAGPHWGVLTKDGRLLAVGSIYAPYLKGDKTYTTIEYTPAGKEVPFTKLTYLGLNRSKGWHEWQFIFDAEKGLKIIFDGKPVNRFDWNKSDVLGFAGITVIGDVAGGKTQTLWVDDVSVVLGGDMKAKPMTVIRTNGYFVLAAEFPPLLHPAVKRSRRNGLDFDARHSQPPFAFDGNRDRHLFRLALCASNPGTPYLSLDVFGGANMSRFS